MEPKEVLMEVVLCPDLKVVVKETKRYEFKKEKKKKNQ
jgi:hypothetical protein